MVKLRESKWEPARLEGEKEFSKMVEQDGQSGVVDDASPLEIYEEIGIFKIFCKTS